MKKADELIELGTDSSNPADYGIELNFVDRQKWSTRDLQEAFRYGIAAIRAKKGL